MSLKIKLFSSLLLSSSFVFAQNPVEGGTTETIVVNASYDGELGVGTISSDNTLIITNEASVGAVSLLVGGTTLGNDNLVQIGSDSYLTVTNGITVGHIGSRNEMDVSGSLYSDGAVIGERSQSSENKVILNGTNAVWTMENDLIIGDAGSDNQIEIMGGGQLSATNITMGAQAGSYGNSLTLTGKTSSVSSGQMIVGGAGFGNMLAVSNGASVQAQDTYVGLSDSAVSNSLYVGGADASYTNLGMLYVGSTGNVGNVVTVTNDATFFIGEGLVISGSNNTFNLDNGGMLQVGNNFNAGMEGFNYNAGSTLAVGGALTGMTNALEEGRGLILAGTNASWNMSGSAVTIGGLSSSNSLDVVNGASASFGSLDFGAGTNSFNTLNVSNEGVVSVSGMLTVGFTNTSGNMVTVQDNGKLLVNELAIYGDENSVDLLKGGWLSVSNGTFDATHLNFGGGSTLEIGGTLTNLVGTLDQQKTLIFNGGSWNVSNVVVGSETGGNSLMVTNGGTVSVVQADIGKNSGANGNTVAVAGSTFSSTGNLIVGGAGADNHLIISDAATVDAGGLIVGQTGKQNAVYLSNGGTLTVTGDTVIGDEAGADGNLVAITGAGSALIANGNLYVGRDGSENSVMLSDQAVLTVQDDLFVQNKATISFASGATASAGTYFQSADSVFSFDSMTNTTDADSPLISGTSSAEFEAGASLDYTGDIGVLAIEGIYTNRLIDSDALTVGGVAATNGVVSGLASDSSGSVMAMQFFALSDDLYVRVLRNSLKGAAGYSDGTQMAAVSDDIDQLAGGGDERANAQLSAANTLSSSTLNTHLSTMYEQSAPTYMHMNGMLEGLKNVRRRGLLPEPLWANEPDESSPEGAEGPHRYGRELYGRQSQMWIKGYGSTGSKDADGSVSGFDQTVYGTVIGVDKAWGDLLAGIAGGYAGSSLDTAGGGGSDATTGYGTLYAAWGSLEWFSDAHIAYGRSSVESDAGGPFDTKGDFNADQVAFYVGGGKEMAFGYEKFMLTPSLGLQGGWYMQDGYTESANNAVPRRVDSYDYLSLQSALGIKVATMHQFMTFALMPEISLNWLHEFNDSIDNVDYSLVGGGDYTLRMQSPVADMFELGLGLSSRNEYEDGEILEFSLQLDGRIGDGYSSVGGSIRAMYEF